MKKEKEYHMEIKKVIFDTDLGGDCDDVGAAAVLCNLAKAGECEILAVTSCIGNPWGSYFLKNELSYFGFSDVPLGHLKDTTYMVEPVYEKYTRAYLEANHLPCPESEDAVRVLRRALVQNGGGRDITLIAIGPLRNIANLLRSGADDLSEKTGRELVAENVREFVTMLGSVERTDYCEWNVLMDIPSARYVVSEMPVPTVFSPFELGDHIQTGNLLSSQPDEHPVKAGYWYWNDKNGYTRCSWDPITVYCAIRVDTPLYERVPVHVSIREDGCFSVSDGADMYYLRQRVADEAVQVAIDPLML